MNSLSKITTHLWKTSSSPDPIFILIGLLKVCIHVLSLSQNTKNSTTKCVLIDSQNKQSKDQSTMEGPHWTSLLTTYTIDDKPNC